MCISQTINTRLESEHSEGLYPIIELHLNGNIAFERILSVVHNDCKIPYKVLKADVEYLGNATFGKIILHLQGDNESNLKVFRYFKQHKIQNSIKGYS